MSDVTLATTLSGISPYAPARHPAPCDLALDETHLPPLFPEVLCAPRNTSLSDESYPDSSELRRRLALEFGVDDARVLITAGADDALFRCFRTVLEPGRSAILTRPTFEMLPRFVRLTGATLREVVWQVGRLPVDTMIAQIDETTALIAVVTPNNPTGATALLEELQQLSMAAPQALLVVDLAYVEFAETDFTRELLTLPNVVVTRTFSKNWGLAALRVGYALSSIHMITALGRAGLPYPVATPSLRIVADSLSKPVAAAMARVNAVRSQRRKLADILDELGIASLPSEANFIYITDARATWIADVLASLGIAVRRFPVAGSAGIRISCPLNAASMARLEFALKSAVRPEAILFDMDGVLADVGDSYRSTIIATAASFGVAISPQAIQARKAAGNANDDWAVTWELINSGGVRADCDEVRERFESIYQGEGEQPGRYLNERLIPDLEFLRILASRFPLAIVTGRPRNDATRFLSDFGISDFFSAVITREDAALKPDPAPVQLALQRLGVVRAWMIGDTPDDLLAARRANVVPIAIAAPGDEVSIIAPQLFAAGASRILTSLTELLSCLP